MSRFIRPPRTRSVTLCLAAVVAISSCVDAPSAPVNTAPPNAGLDFAPVFSLVGPSGVLVNARQADALDEAFDLVDNFRFVVRRVSNNSVVLDTIISVSPGEDEYDFSFDVSAGPNEEFTVSLTAFQGEMELFEAPAIQVRAAPPAAAGGGAAAPTNVAMQYSGPGATATTVQITPSQLMLGPGDDTELVADVQDQDGSSLDDVLVVWSSAAAGVATVDDGTVTGVADGITSVTVTTPTGLEASATVYVVDGTLAYVRGGSVRTRDAVGGDESNEGGSDAAGPAWSADGSRLFYSDAGAVREAGEGRVVDGEWPSLSPDGTKLAFERDGQVFFSNDDGSNPTAGPDGSMPVWDGSSDLLVAGGSVERVGADGGGRSTVAEGIATAPALSADGDIAYTRGGELRVAGRAAPLMLGASGRPTWSANGHWLVVKGDDGLTVVPASGDGAAMPLPGLDAASDPAFKPSGSLSSPPTLALSGLDPEEPVPGEAVTIHGSGFDWIIPSNNTANWATDEGRVETDLTAIGRSSISTTTPRKLVSGQLRVATRTGEAVLAYELTFGSLEMHAMTPWGAPVPDVLYVLTDSDGAEAARGATDSDGMLFFAALRIGEYTLEATAPRGFDLVDDASIDLELGAEKETVETLLMPELDRVEFDPAHLELGVGETIDVTVTPLDVNGDVIPEIDDILFLPGAPHYSVKATGLEARVTGTAPTEPDVQSHFRVRIQREDFDRQIFVTSYIGGTVTGPAPAAAEGMALAAAGLSGVEVQLRGAGVEATTKTDSDGKYRFGRLFAGEYEVEVVPPEGLFGPGPETVTLDDRNPTETVNFELGTSAVGERRAGDIAIYKDYDPWFGDKKNELALQAAPFNFVKDEDYVVRHTSEMQDGIPAQTSIIILGSASNGSSPVTNVNHPDAQSSLESWVSNGGWLVAHVGDNVGGTGFMIPGLTGIADDFGQCTKETLQVADHPFIRGPDGILGTGDDLSSPLGNLSGCYDNHGSVEGILPGDALVLLREAGGSQRATYAAYSYGAGYVVVTTLTLEFSGHDPKTLRNHLWWTIMSGADAAPVAPMLAPALMAAPQVTRNSDDPPGRGR